MGIDFAVVGWSVSSFLLGLIILMIRWGVNRVVNRFDKVLERVGEHEVRISVLEERIK